MNITELQTLLHEQAENVDDQGTVARGSQMQHRIVVAKRRRTAGVVAAVAVVLAGTATGLANLPGGDDDTTPPVSPTDGPTFKSSEAGRRLIDSVVSEKGAGEARLSTRLDTAHIVLSAECYSDGRDLWYEVHVNGEYSESGGCQPGEAPAQLGATGTQGAPGRAAPWAGVTDDGGPFEVEIFTTRGDKGPRVTDPTTRLVAGVYRLPEAKAVVAGYELYELAEFDGREWQLASYSESDPGARHRESSVDGAGPDQLALVYVSSFQGMARISANGEGQSNIGGGGGTRFVVPAKGGNRSVEVQLTQDTEGTIGIAWYTPVESGE